MDNREKNKQCILEWTGTNFPMEVRAEAALVYTDYVRDTHNTDTKFYINNLKFGTGGIRGILGNGPGRMNYWTVGRVTIALCHVLLAKYSRPSLVIAYDSRRMSYEFAESTVKIASGLGLRVYLFYEVTPTPILSYAVRKLKAKGGVVITASHNPPEYNGYKIYDANGAQIVAQKQVEIEQAISLLKEWPDMNVFNNRSKSYYGKQVHIIGPKIRESYIKELGKLSFVTSSQHPGKSSIKIVYTPLHGTGGGWLPAVLKYYGFSVTMVASQAKPDGEFPSVKYPNPEDASALKLADELASRLQADIFLATDPDADRLGVGVRNSDGKYIYLNGNQLGSIFCAFLCENFYLNKKIDKNNRNEGQIFKTIVTTDLQRCIAEAYEFELCEVLTGFKYIAEQMNLLETKGKISSYIFGGEESYGYLPVNFVRDKDALSSALLLCEIVTKYKDLTSYLDQIYLRYGLYLEELKSITLQGNEGIAKITAVLEGLRSQNLSKWEMGKRKIIDILDYRDHLKNGKPSPETFQKLPRSNMIQLILEPEAKLTIRPSGTEPKLKIYISLRYQQKLKHHDELRKAKIDLEEEIEFIMKYFLKQVDL